MSYQLIKDLYDSVKADTNITALVSAGDIKVGWQNEIATYPTITLFQVGGNAVGRLGYNTNISGQIVPEYIVDYNLTVGRIRPHNDGVWALFQTQEPNIMEEVSIRIYDYLNGSLIYGGSSTLATVNFSYAGALANRTYYYVLRHNGTETQYSFVTSWYIYQVNQSLGWNGTSVNEVFEFILGLTIFRNEETGNEVSWINGGLIFGVFLLIFLSGKGVKAEVPMLTGASGLWFIFAGTIFLSAVSLVVLPLGVILLFIAFIYKKESQFA